MIVQQYVKDLISQKIDELKKHNLIDKYGFEAQFKRHKDAHPEYEDWRINAELLRYKCLMDFRAFCILVNLPFFRNNVYNEYVSLLDKHQEEINKLWITYHKHKERREEKECQVILQEIKGLKLQQKDTTLFMIPRGALKTTMMICARSAYLYLRDTIFQKKAPIIMLLHGNVDKAEENLKLVKDFFDHEIVSVIFQDVLGKTKNTANSLRFRDQSEIKRKEDHFMTGSAGQEFGGKHATYYMIDDWALDKLVDSIEKNNSNIKAFYKLRWLNDHSGNFRLECVGTHYTDDTIYCELEKIPEDALVFKRGATSMRADGSTSYNFEEIDDYTKDRLEKLKRKTPHDQYMSQVEMIPYNRSEKTKLADELPTYRDPYDLVRFNKEQIESSILLIDPANSSSNKKSMLVIHAVVVTKLKNVYVVDSYNSPGTTPTEFIEAVFSMADRFKVNHLVIEKISAQVYMRNHIEEERNKRRAEGKSGNLNFSILTHAHYINKKAHYKSYLEPIISQKKLFVNPKCDNLIKEIKGQSSLDDNVDCLSFLIELGIDFSDIHQIMTNEEEYEQNFRRQMENKSVFVEVTDWM